MHFYAYANILVALKLAHPNPYAKGDINSLLKVSVISCMKTFGVFRTFWKRHIFLVSSRLVSYCEILISNIFFFLLEY